MRFDLIDLALFIAVADARSITGGAERSNLALPSASARIKGLEDLLGASLLSRGRRGVTLTAAGEALLGHARVIMHDVDLMRDDLAGYASGFKASVRLFANTSVLSEHLPKVLAAFLRQHPQINVDIEERESTDIADAIVRGAADLGFAAEHALPHTIERFPFSKDRLVLVTALRSDLAKRRHIDFHETAAHEFIGLTQAVALQKHIVTHAARLGVRLKFRAHLRDFDAICRLVAADVGVAVVPEIAARRCTKSMPISIVRIRDGWANRRLVICARNFESQPRPVRLLVEHLKRHAEVDGLANIR